MSEVVLYDVKDEFLANYKKRLSREGGVLEKQEGSFSYCVDF